jgi:hypothetical protein
MSESGTESEVRQPIAYVGYRGRARSIKSPPDLTKLSDADHGVFPFSHVTM